MASSFQDNDGNRQNLCMKRGRRQCRVKHRRHKEGRQWIWAMMKSDVADGLDGFATGLHTEDGNTDCDDDGNCCQKHEYIA